MSSEAPRFAKPVEFATGGARAATAAASIWANDARPAVALPGDDRLISEFAAELGQHLAEASLYRRGDMLVMTPAQDGRGLRTVGDEEFRTLVEKQLRCFSTRSPARGEAGVIEIMRTMSKDIARAVLASPQFRLALPFVEQVNDVPLPVMRKDGTIALLPGATARSLALGEDAMHVSPGGYDAESRTLTLQAATYDTVGIDEARREIRDLLGEFHFADDRSRAVAVAAMVSLFAGGLLPPGALRPAFIYLANAPGAGKTTAADCAVVPVFGRAYRTPAPQREEEMTKTLLAAVIAAQPVIFLDNVKGHTSSPSLEALLTSNYYSGRVLSASQMFSGPNRATVIVTGNGCTTSPDLQRRALICELFSEHARPEDRTFEHRLGEATLVARRIPILSALWAFVRHWDLHGRPKPSQVRPGIEEWCDIIGGIVEFAGYACPVTSPRLRDGGGDTDGADFAALVRALAQAAGLGSQFEFSQVAKVAAERGLFERIITGDGDELDRESRARFAKILAGKDRMIFPGEPPLRFLVVGKGHSRRYRLELVAPAPSPPATETTTS